MSKEHAYAYEAGYRDGSIHYELEHCPACKNVADLQEALTENAKLRELLSDVCAASSCERGDTRNACTPSESRQAVTNDVVGILTDDEMVRYDTLIANLDARMADMPRRGLMAETRYWHVRAYMMGACRDRLMQRNTKLRELINDLWMLYHHGSDCIECPKSVYDECERLASGGCNGSFIIRKRMRDLGMEVRDE